LVVPREDEAPDPVVSSGVRTFDELVQDAETAAAEGDQEKALELLLEAADRGRQQRDAEASRVALQAAMQQFPDRGEPYFAWGQFCIDRADYDEAMKAFRKALDVKPRWPEAMLGLGEAATESHEYDLALVTLKQLVRFAPDHPGAAWSLASLYDQHLGNVSKAMSSYQQFIRAFPDDPRIVKAQQRMSVLERRLAKERAKQEAERPVAAPKKKPEPKPEPKPKPKPKPEGVEQPVKKPETRRTPDRNTTAAVEAYNRGTKYQERKDFSTAIYYYLRALENDPTFANAYYNLGTAYKATGDYRRAKDAYLHAVQLRPRMVNARYNLALVYVDLKEYSAAIEQLRSTLKLNPKHAPSHYVLGMLYARNRQAGALARRHYQRFLELAPRDPSAPSVRAWLRANP
jgi:tetratricopeptide (TPR) repeat protein